MFQSEFSDLVQLNPISWVVLGSAGVATAGLLYYYVSSLPSIVKDWKEAANHYPKLRALQAKTMDSYHSVISLINEIDSKSPIGTWKFQKIQLKSDSARKVFEEFTLELENR